MDIVSAEREAQSRRILPLVMTDKRLIKYMHGKDKPFNGKRMFWGDFKAFVKI